MATMQPWHDFFILTGTAAATLLGLIFLAAAIAASIPNEKLGDDKTRALWILPVVWAFVRVLVVSAIGLIPGQTATAFGTVLLVLGVLDLARMVRVTVGIHRVHRTREPLDANDWGWYVIYPAVATLLVAGTGLALAREWTFPVAALAAGLLGHLVVGVRNAWDIADWLATRQ
jgi:hypothetical protein